MKTFKQLADEVGATEDVKKSAVRALQVWQFLLGKARNRQLVKYGEIAELLGYTDNRPLSHILGQIMYYCQHEGLPPLTVIVVNQEGAPGDGFTQVQRDTLDQNRECTFGYDWFSIVPPTPAEFDAARTSEKSR
jgi:putative restriction endonuclease